MGIPIPKDMVLEKVMYIVKQTCTENRCSLNDKDFEKLSIEVIANERNEIYS
jgi:hypothetical protein